MTSSYNLVRTPAKRDRTPSARYSKTSPDRPWTLRLLEILRDPPADYDGSNAKLAEYLGLSQRHVIRIIKKLESQGAIVVKRTIMSFKKRVFTERTIRIVAHQEQL